MTPFEYVIVLISIILGLGITTIVTGVANFVKHPPAGKLYPPYIIWIVLVFVLHIQEWWESYSLQSIEAWRLPVFLFIILYPIALYILAHLLFPADFKAGLATKTFYLDNYSRLFVTAIAVAALGMIHNLFILKLPLKEQVLQGLIIATLSFMVITRNRNSAVHHTIAIMLVIAAIASLAVEDVSLLG